MNTKDLINSLVHAIANYPVDNFYRDNARCALQSSLRCLLAGDDAKARDIVEQAKKYLLSDTAERMKHTLYAIQKKRR
tara:strand:- start:412 stop:645 length:234 start_codon:yes stop_codon:yes gene_type:complete